MPLGPRTLMSLHASSLVATPRSGWRPCLVAMSRARRCHRPSRAAGAGLAMGHPAQRRAEPKRLFTGCRAHPHDLGRTRSRRTPSARALERPSTHAPRGTARWSCPPAGRPQSGGRTPGGLRLTGCRGDEASQAGADSQRQRCIVRSVRLGAARARLSRPPRSIEDAMT
jgi:hypothetical protein